MGVLIQHMAVVALARRGPSVASRVPFSAIRFGSNAAEDEAASDPRLLTEGFYDPRRVTQKIVDGDVWLILGPKGAGKSAITENLRLRSRARDNWYVKRLELLDFPFIDIANLDVGGTTRAARLPVVWTYLICLQILTSLEQDEGLQAYENRDIEKMIAEFRRANLVPAKSLRDTLFRVSRFGLKAKPPGFEASVDFDRSPVGPALPFYHVAEKLREIVATVDLDSIHIVAIDGLDTLAIGEDDETRWSVLTALVTACDRINRILREGRSPIRLVLLCRADIFNALGYTDSNKILGAGTALLNWFPDSRRATDSELLDLAEKKALASAGVTGDLIANYLPSEIRVGGANSRPFPIHEFLMSYTRYLPRDYLQLLNYIAQHSPPHGLPGNSHVRDGAKSYATNYFIEEVRTGLLPLLGRRDTNLLIDLLGQMPGHIFGLGILKRLASSDKRYNDIDLVAAVHQLHHIGVLANSIKTGSETYYNFVYHNPRARLDLSGQLMMHNALVVGLNRPRQVVRRV